MILNDSYRTLSVCFFTSTIMNWHKSLNKAWQCFYKKKKVSGEEITSNLISFAENYQTRIAVIKRHLQRRDYNFGKWRAVLIPKKDGGKRPLVVPSTISDKLVLKAISDYLSNELSNLFSSVGSISYAYQKGKSTRDALIRLKKMHNPENVLLKIDIMHFFDDIDRIILIQLLEHYPIDDYVKELINKSINPTVDYSKLEKDDIDKFPKGGIPQGNPISAVLSNLYLYGLDRLAISKGWKMVRYADDMVLSVSNIEDAQIILSQIDNYLFASRKLTIHPLGKTSDSKTSIFSNVKKNRMEYLGVIFDGQNLFPTKACIHNLVEKVKKILKRTSTSEEKEIAIKRAIAQWCGYYAFTDISDRQIKGINNSINHQLKKCNIQQVDITDCILKARKRQNRHLIKLFRLTKFGEEYDWLNIYS